MGGIFSQPKMKAPPLPPPEPPVGIPETGAGDVTQKRKLIKSGRGGTILAGQLAPANIFKKRILG